MQPETGPSPLEEALVALTERPAVDAAAVAHIIAELARFQIPYDLSDILARAVRIAATAELGRRPSQAVPAQQTGGETAPYESEALTSGTLLFFDFEKAELRVGEQVYPGFSKEELVVLRYLLFWGKRKPVTAASLEQHFFYELKQPMLVLAKAADVFEAQTNTSVFDIVMELAIKLATQQVPGITIKPINATMCVIDSSLQQEVRLESISAAKRSVIVRLEDIKLEFSHKAMRMIEELIVESVARPGVWVSEEELLAKVGNYFPGGIQHGLTRTLFSLNKSGAGQRFTLKTGIPIDQFIQREAKQVNRKTVTRFRINPLLKVIV